MGLNHAAGNTLNNGYSIKFFQLRAFWASTGPAVPHQIAQNAVSCHPHELTQG